MALLDRGSPNAPSARTAVAVLWDFLLIFSYSIGFAGLLEWLAAKDPNHADPLIGYAAWGAFAAGAADVIENISMLVMLSKYQNDPHANLGLPALSGTLAPHKMDTPICSVRLYDDAPV